MPFPSVSDGRDLLSSIIKKKWAPSTTSVDIINVLPTYIAELYQKCICGMQLELGTFHLGDVFRLLVWENKEFMKCFYCTEIGIENFKSQTAKLLVVTHSKILELEPYQEQPIMGKLISWATLQSINSIMVSKSEPHMVIIE